MCISACMAAAASAGNPEDASVLAWLLLINGSIRLCCTSLLFLQNIFSVWCYLLWHLPNQHICI